jgi:hypothetical protein
MKETVGKVARDLQLKPEANDPVELQREAQKDYIDNLIWTISHMQKKVDCSHLVKKDAPGTAHHQECATREAWMGDHYVVVTCKKEKILENVIRNLFHGQRYCPTPTYDQSVYKYHAADEKLEYLWTVPDVDTCDLFLRNAGHVPKDEQQLLQMVIDFSNGTLLAKCKQLNGEV